MVSASQGLSELGMRSSDVLFSFTSVCNEHGFVFCFIIKRKSMLFFKSFTSVSGSVLSPWRRESLLGM